MTSFMQLEGRIISVTERLADMCSDGEDGTVDFNGFPLPEVGYFVGSGVGIKFAGAGDVDKARISDLINMTPWLDHYGVWTDTETGIIYVDAVNHYSELEDALYWASQNGELAIWDIRMKDEIRLDGLVSI